MLRLSVVISIKGIPLPPTAYHPCRQYSKPCATPLCGPRPPFFCWPRAIGSRPYYLTFASTSPATHLCSTSMRSGSEGSAHTLATSTPKNHDSGWSGGKLDWLHQGMQVPKLSLLSSLTQALQLPGSGRLPLVRRDGSPHSVKACVRLQCLCLPCRRLPGSVLVLLHDMCEDDPRHFSP